MNEFKKGWGPLLAASLGTMCGLMTVTNYSQGFFVGAVAAEFGWTPPQFFMSFTIMMCMGLICGPLIGSLAGKYGVRLLGVIGLVGHCIGYLIISMNNGSLIMWYLSFALLALLGAGSLPIIWTAVLNDYFNKHKGKAIGITMTGTGIGALVLPPITSYLIDGYGWRVAYQAIGIGALVISLPIILAFFKTKPKTEIKSNEKSVSDWGYTRTEATLTRNFWLLGGVLFFTVFVIVGLLSNFKQILLGKGYDGETIAWVASVMGLMVIIGRLSVGFLVDKFWAPAVASVIFVLPIIGMMILITVPSSTFSALLVAVTLGLAAGAELDMLAYLTSKYFGPRYYSEVFGSIFAFFTVGAGIAPPIFGAIGQNNGYETVLVGSIVILAACIAMFLSLGRYSAQEQLSV